MSDLQERLTEARKQAEEFKEKIKENRKNKKDAECNINFFFYNFFSIKKFYTPKKIYIYNHFSLFFQSPEKLFTFQNSS